MNNLLDLQQLLSDVKPNIITPHLATLLETKNDKKPRTLSQLLVLHLHSSMKNPVAKQIFHDGTIHTIRYFDIEPLMTGVWAEMSLMLLHLSYSEQCDIIDAIYPDTVKLTAKAFAINFTKDAAGHTVIPVTDEDVSKRLDSLNVGVAMILATLANMGGQASVHPDILKHFYTTMETVATQARERDTYAANLKRSQDASRFRDLQQ